MDKQMEQFRNHVIENFSRKDFTYHEWMIDYHLKIVERIAMELCDKYSNADRDVVHALVWFHDYGKPIDENNERGITATEGVKALAECGFAQDFIEKVVTNWQIMERKNEIDLHSAPIEAQIVSTADGMSHFVGVFYASYFGDGGDFATTQRRLKEKITKDWDRKIVLPEARQACEVRYLRAKELLGEFPDKFL
jgi:putative nucleotidyltransferase with HDIG domain